MSNRRQMDLSQSIILDPGSHGESVQGFLRFFDLPDKDPSTAYLEQILTFYARLPYENISKIIKLRKDFTSPERLRLPEEVMDDHARFHLGGTCFSLTFFLQSILTLQGFSCYPVMADMRNRPNVHCALIVLLNGARYLVDPGYLLTRPMEIHPDKPRLYRTEHTGVELMFNVQKQKYHLLTFDRQQSKWRYCFVDRPTPADEFLRHWQASFVQGTMHGICLTRVSDQGIIYLHKDYLQVSNNEGREKRKIKQNYHVVISDLFSIAPEWVEQALAAIPENMALERQFGLGQCKHYETEDEAR
jgi:arylamine N-acetyltransferase